MNVQCKRMRKRRQKCTASLMRTPRARRAAWLWLALALAALLAGAPAARADIELGHVGETGRHRLADMYDSPGAICDIVRPAGDSLGETWLRVNPPIIFARDRTLGVDAQDVGWRVEVSILNEAAGTWRVVRRSGITRTTATDDLATYFDGDGWLAGFPLSRATYTATIEMLWFDPDNAQRVEGQASHAVEHYMIVLREDGETRRGRTQSVCSPH